MLFDYCVSNPPYQKKTIQDSTGRTHYTKCYNEFQHYATTTCAHTLMIYPSGWVNSLHTGYGAEIRTMHLHHVFLYDGTHVFNKAIASGYPVGIIHTDSNHNGNIYVNNHINNITSTRWIYDQWLADTLHDTHGEPTYSFHTEFLSDISSIQSSNLHVLSQQDNYDDVLIYVKNKPGTQADADWRWITYEEALKYFNEDDIDSYTVSIPNSFFKQYRLIRNILDDSTLRFGYTIFPPGFVHGNTYRKITSCATAQEAEKLVEYLDNPVITRLTAYGAAAHDFASLVPIMNNDSTWYKHHDVL